MELSRATGKPFHRELHTYVIRNGKLEPEWSGVKRRTVNIGARAISALIQTQGINDLARIYATAQQDDSALRERPDLFLQLLSDFNDLHNEQFNATYMKRLFDYGYQLSVKGYAWHKAPPGEARLNMTDQYDDLASLITQTLSSA